MIECDGIKSAMDIATNLTKHCLSKKVRYWYILYTVLLVITLLLIFTIISYHHVKHNSKQKGINELTI